MTAPARSTPLSEPQIVEAALRLAHRVGVERLTMRGLAEELGVTTMATYRHVKSKDELIRLVADAVLSRTSVNDDGRAWDVQLWDISRANRDEFVKYPGLVDYLTHHELLPAGRRQMAESIGLMRNAGFSPEDARQAYAALYSYLWGRIALTSRISGQRQGSGRRRAGGITRADLTSEASIEFGYRAMVQGIKQMLGPQQ